MFTPEEIEEHLARIERERLQRAMDAMDIYDLRSTGMAIRLSPHHAFPVANFAETDASGREMPVAQVRHGAAGYPASTGSGT